MTAICWKRNTLHIWLRMRCWKDHSYIILDGQILDHHQKLLRFPQIYFFFLTALTAQTTQTEEFLFLNVAYWLTVYRTGLLGLEFQTIWSTTHLSWWNFRDTWGFRFPCTMDFEGQNMSSFDDDASRCRIAQSCYWNISLLDFIRFK